MEYMVIIVNSVYLMVSCALIFSFMDKLFERSYTRGYIKYYFMMISFMFIIHSFQNTYLNYLASFLFFIILCKKLFFSNDVNIYLYTFLFIFLVVSMELIVLKLISTIVINVPFGVDGQYIFISLVSLIIDLILYSFFINHLAHIAHLKYRNHKLELAILSLSLLIVIELCLLSGYNISIFGKISALLLCNLIVVCDVIFLYFIEKKSVENDLMLKRGLQEVKSQCKFNSYEELRENYLEQKKFLHDIKAHLSVLDSLYSNGNYDKVVNYKKKVMEKINFDDYFSEDPILQILLSKTYRKCKDNNIEFICIIKSDVNLDCITDYDKVTIFSNIINNSIEACCLSSQSEKVITIDIMKLNDALVICIRNTYDTVIYKNKNKYVSTKKNHIGIGIDNTIETVNKLNGMINFNNSENEFEVIIYIPNNETHAL